MGKIEFFIDQGVGQNVSWQRLFRPFNVAPVDSPLFRFSDFSCACRILTECGLGLTPMGYYT